MFDIAWSELALIGAVALVVIGPKDLPKVMRTMGQWTRRARLLAGEFQRNIDDMVHQADLDDVRRQVRSITPSAVKAHVENMVGADVLRDGLIKTDAASPPPPPAEAAPPKSEPQP